MMCRSSRPSHVFPVSRVLAANSTLGHSIAQTVRQRDMAASIAGGHAVGRNFLWYILGLVVRPAKQDHQ